MTSTPTITTPQTLLKEVITLLRENNHNNIIKVTYSDTKTNEITLRYWIEEDLYQSDYAAFTYLRRKGNTDYIIENVSQYELLDEITAPLTRHNSDMEVHAVDTKRKHKTPIPYLTTNKETYKCPSCPNAIYCHPWKKDSLTPEQCECGEKSEWVTVNM